tara:strand:- start:309 stop:1514 length:1206 start_codon:yes stop_codon:yes gene_type:complete
MIFDTERHLPIGQTTWSADAAEQALRDVLHGAIRDYSEETFWQTPAVAKDDPDVASTIYLGGMGVLWAIDHLQNYIQVDLPFEKQALATRLYQRFVEKDVQALTMYSVDGKSCPSYFLGETGMLLVMSKLQASSSAAHWDKLLPMIRQNMKNPTMEALWGGTGSIIPAVFKLQQEDSEAWREVFIEHCQFMKDTVSRDNSFNSPIWTQDLYGLKRTLLGAGHGFVGNLFPFIKGRQFLPKGLADWVLNDAVETMVRSAVVEGDCCNWPAELVTLPDKSPKFLMQWCHGAPGVITSLNEIPVGYAQEFDALLLKAGEGVWQAGPLTKGVGICHGTDGNGYALLKLYTRTGDPKWLERARAFAMYAIEQNINGHSLWEGDLGLACYLHACLKVDDRFPLLDVY